MAAKKKTADKTKNTTAGRKKTSSKTSSKGTKTASRTKASAVPKRSSGLSPRVRAILYAAVAAVFVCIIFIKGSNVWTMIRSFFFGVLGFGIFLVPVTLFYLCVMTEKEKQVARYKLKLFLCVVIILFIGALIYAGSGAKYSDMNLFACLGNLFKDASDTTNYMTFGCGIIGGLLGYPLVVLFGSTAALFTSFVATAALILIVANISIKDMTAAASRTAVHIREAGEERARVRRERREENRERKLAERGNIDIALDGEPRKRSGSFIDIPLDDKKSKTKKSKPEVNGIDTDIADSKEENAADKDLSQDLINIINRASKPMGKSADNTVSAIAEDISNEKSVSKAEPKQNKPDPETESIAKKALLKSKKDDSEEADDEIADQLDRAVRSDNSQSEEKKYQFPPIQLLKPKLNSDDSDAMEEMQNNAKKLIDTLTSFGVKASIVNICRGPSVTRYELQPAPGVKISKITNLSDDIALNLAANGVRIEAPIPGKAAVGIEVPNKVVSMVTMRELIDSDKFRNSKSKLTTVLGRDISGEIVVTDLAKMPHLLIAGTTGSGKSVCVNSILMSILYKATPDEVKLLLIDPKMVEFSKYKGIPHLLIPVVSDAKKAAGALAWAVNEMLQRYKIFSEYDCKDIDSYNSLIEKNMNYMEKNPPVVNEEGEEVQPVLEVNGLPVAKEKMSRVVIAIDELADLMMAAPSEVEDSICRLAQMARAAGMHLILATQRPTVNVITGLIKANVPSRISLKVSSNTDSRTILDTGGGEKLIGRGDMLFSPVGAPKPIRVQGCYASDEEIEGVTHYIKKAYSAQYNSEIEEKIKRIAAEEIAQGKKSGDSDSASDEGLDVDSKMEEAIKCVIEAGQASTSLLQRRLKVGYARAGRMIDDMEQMGVVGPHQGSKPRDVLMTYNEWLERRNALENRAD
ncbi:MULTISPECIES: DNA translocase FtsK [Ruminococcus]|uniref:DNA translocase FtsK n=1 Tax=Ruminococcus TaxID=1263 RepID=UPI0025D7245E|nr:MULTISPECIES: DNA translocase FtsK [Ruminococcus]